MSTGTVQPVVEFERDARCDVFASSVGRRGVEDGGRTHQECVLDLAEARRLEGFSDGAFSIVITSL
jgi:hypothetical protein